jgi:hypothetical protein
LIAFLVCVALVSVSSGQVAFSTGRSDNQRTGANVNETLLTPSNVNKNAFGSLFSYPIDYLALAQPLYVPSVTIPNLGTHNVVYVATMADSVYAFDADSNAGLNASPLWSVNFTDPAAGITTANTVAYLPCSGGKTTGFTQEGIAGTPVIDSTTGTMYLVVKTLENGTVVHRLHALDITTGGEKFGGPIQIKATSTSNKGTVATFTSLHQLNRPGLLLLNGVVYVGFGSNGCDDGNASGWVLSYDPASLSQIAAFNASPDHGLASIWQTGNGLAADESGNIFVETAETCYPCYDVNSGGQTYSNSVIELAPNLTVADYFTPYDVQFLNTHDEDLSSTGVLILPDQDGVTPHELVAGGKEGFVYVLDRDSLGGYDNGTCGNPGPTCDNDLEEFALFPTEQPEQVKDGLFSSPAYWNNTVYFSPNGSPLLAYPVSSGPVPLGTPLQTAQSYVGAHSPSISANGNTNGILWNISGSTLYAFNAATLQMLYDTKQAASGRDTLPPVAHFATQTVANGKVYVATQTTLQVYGLFQSLTVVGGNNQSGAVFSTLPAPLQLQVIDPYSGVGIPNVTVTFNDAGKGTVNPASVVSDANGNVSTNYTFSKIAGIYTITASSTKAGSVSFTETALPGAASKIIIHSGNKQTGQAGSILPTQLKVEVEDSNNNAVPGIPVTFADQSKGGTLNPSSIASNSSGFAQVSYQLPNPAGPVTYKITANATGVTTAAQFVEYATGAAPTSLVVVSGNNQTAPVNTALPQPLVVQVNDPGGNPIAGVSVVFSASSGSFTGTPATTGSNGQATANYTAGTSVGAVTVTAAVNALNTQLAATVTAGTPATVTISGGNNQTAGVGTTLPQALGVVVADQYGNVVPGVNVYYSDGGAGGTFSNPNPSVTNSSGAASELYTFSQFPSTVTISAAATGANNPAVFTEISVPGPAFQVNIVGGNNQFAPAGTQLPQYLTVAVVDQYGNPVAGVNVSFSDGGAGGSFSNPNPVATNSSGKAIQMYTLPPTAGTVYISAAATGVAVPAVFTETGQ